MQIPNSPYVHVIGEESPLSIPPVVAVHPFFARRRVTMPSSDLKDYEYHLLQLVNHHKGALVVTEDRNCIHDTVETLNFYGRSNGIYVFSTGLISAVDPRPDIGWNEFLLFLRQFDGEPIALVGGYYRKPYGGCLGGTALKLEQAGLHTKVLRDVTFC